MSQEKTLAEIAANLIAGILREGKSFSAHHGNASYNLKQLGAGLPRYIAGLPMLSEGKQALDLLQNLRRLSEPFHTNIEIEGESGIIRIG